MAKFVVSRVEEQRVFGIRCPFEGCQNELHEQDIEKLVQCGALPAEVGTRLADLRKQDYTARAMELSVDGQHTAEDFKLMRRLWATTRRCPRCNVIIEKSEGCDSFGCTCGHRFNFAKAPRGCGDGIDDFDSVTALAGDFEMPLQAAVERVQKANQSGIAKYKNVLARANQSGMPLDLAEVHVRASLGQRQALEQLRVARVARRLEKKAQVLAAALGVAFEEATQLLDDAFNGDEDAQSAIHSARQREQNGSKGCESSKAAAQED